MTIAKNVRRIAHKITMPLSVAAILGFGLLPSFAQSVTEGHLQAARKAISAIHATDQFDSFLPDTARELKNELMRRDPNLQKDISEIVNEQALALVSRRADLEREAAYAYAKYFSEQELNDIAAFYNSEAGKKLLSKGPEAVGETIKAFDVWRQAIAQDLAANVGKELNAKFVQNNVIVDPNAPKTESEEAKPVTEEAKPATEEAKPAIEEAKPATEEAKPATEEAKPATEETKPATEEAKPATEEAKPATEEAKPATEEAKPATEEAKPAN
ncbi:DUF2059 domain-containing protein [Bartonella sp. HY406]|uniref:DUF2059 domain-containing protein n=1 Tax=Bartonella sp. HY406 TaxID=2979331 RepID=UPI0021C7708C|nr:DUF2059 domain-containing protein [Bartonella sp. HY406]UXN04050.1 DUF2059 domain-containing protein [Bartonella sp. HY406]